MNYPVIALLIRKALKLLELPRNEGLMGEKKVKGRKRHIVTDTQGNLLHVKVHEANTHDTVAGCDVIAKAFEKYPSLKGVCADAGYRKTMEEFVRNILQRTIEISERIAPGWAVLAKRWVVERTFAWLNHFRRLSKDYEIAVAAAENMLMIAHSMLLLKRIANS